MQFTDYFGGSPIDQHVWVGEINPSNSRLVWMDELVGRTLKTMERYGIVKLIPHNKSKQPVAKATQFDIKYGYRYG